MPVAVKLSPYFSSTGEMALRLDEAGADALVLFNRFLQPDIDPETLAVVPEVGLSSPAEARLPRTWIALLHGRVRASLAATTGVETSADVAKYLLAGADVVMTASALLRHGPEHATVLLDGLSDWMARKGFAAVDELRGHARRAARHRRGGLRARGLRRARCGRPTAASTGPGEPAAGDLPVGLFDKSTWPPVPGSGDPRPRNDVNAHGPLIRDSRLARIDPPIRARTGVASSACCASRAATTASEARANATKNASLRVDLHPTRVVAANGGIGSLPCWMLFGRGSPFVTDTSG